MIVTMESLLESRKVMARSFSVIMCLVLLVASTGCSILSETLRQARAKRLKIEKGVSLECCGGKLRVEVPEGSLMVETNKPFPGGIVLRSIYPFGPFSRTYAIQPVNAGVSTNGADMGLKGSLEQHLSRTWRPEIASLIKPSRSETNLWGGKPSYYHEWLIPGDIRQSRFLFFKLKNSWEIKRPHVMVIGRLVPVDSGFCWLHMFYELDDFEPVPRKWTDPKAVERFADFAEEVSVVP